MTAVSIAPPPILQFFNNAGQPNAGGSVLTQVGGVNYPTYEDAAGTIPLPNPIPLNSRGEISNASGVSCQLFLEAGIAYTFTLRDASLNQINQATYTAAPVPSAGGSTTQSIVWGVANIAALRGIDHRVYQNIATQGYYAIADGGSGQYAYDSTDTSSGAVFTGSIIPNAAPTIAPTLGSVAGGALGATTYYAKITLVSAAGESTPSPESSLAVLANNLLTVASPAVQTGVTGYNVYVSTATGTETLQNASPIAIGTAWTEPTSGLVSGAALPVTNNLGSVLTVSAITNGTLVSGDQVNGNGIIVGTIFIAGLISGAGGTGTYAIYGNYTVGLQAMTSDNGGTIIVAADGGRWYLQLTDLVSVKQFGAKGDGVNADQAAFAAVVGLNIRVYCPPGTYRFTASVAIPNSCLTQFEGDANLPIPQSKFFVDFNGPAFTSAVGNTSFYCFDNFYCYSTTGYAAAQFIADSGTLTHGRLTRLVVNTFNGKAIQLASAFRCTLDVLIQYCSDYGIAIAGGSATRVKFTADHTYAGGVNITGAGFVIEPYTENCCMDNNPAGANASWREMLLYGAQHTVLGGVMSVDPNNNKYPIEQSACRAVTYIGVRGYSLGAAPYWINLDANDSSATAINCPDFTYGGTTTNLIVIDPGYTTTGPDVTIEGQSVRNTTARVWACFVGATGAINQANGVSTITRTGVGTYTIAWAAGTFANANYVVDIAAELSGTALSFRYQGKTATQIDILINNSTNAAAVDPTEVSFSAMGV